MIKNQENENHEINNITNNNEYNSNLVKNGAFYTPRTFT